MVNERKARLCLRQSISLAEMLESRVSHSAHKKKITFVGFGFLVRNRRLAQAILQLGSQHAYEARMLLRSMLEIRINYSWICIRDRECRANRFIKYQPLEQLKILKELSDFYDPREYQQKLKNFKNKCAKVRHLFRHRNNKNKLKWDRSWASSVSLESRLRDVYRSKTGKYDMFLYSLYRWTSSAIHGSIHSFSEILELSRPLQAKSQPESNPVAQIVGAFSILISTIRSLAMDANEFDFIEVELLRLENKLSRMKG
jgi:hypothetical protein